MKLNYAPILNKFNPNVAIRVIPITLDYLHSSIDGSQRRETAMSQKIENTLKNTIKREGYKKRSRNNKEESYLSLEVIRKMLNRFLLEKEVRLEDLAQALDIEVRKLKILLLKKKAPMSLIASVNLPLIQLYCETKFDN